MATLIVRHKVRDYTAWKKTYDSFDAERRSMGVTGHAVYQTDADPNDLTVLHDFKDLAAAHKFASSSRLKEVMEEAGVTGQPDMWFTNKQV